MAFQSAALFVRKTFGYQFPRSGRTVMEFVTRNLPDNLVVELLPRINVSLNLRDDVMRAVFWSGTRYERPTGDLIAGWIRSGADRFFDIGANFGFFSLYAASLDRGLQIAAFEPNPDLASRLRTTAAENQLPIKVNEIGVSDAPQTLKLAIGEVATGHSTFGAHPNLQTKEFVEVPVLPFDEWLERESIPLPTKPTWVAKIDVEGFETRVIRGMEKALKAKAFKGLCVEFNANTLNFCGSSGEELLSLITPHGYKVVYPDSKPYIDTNVFFEPV